MGKNEYGFDVYEIEKPYLDTKKLEDILYQEDLCPQVLNQDYRHRLLEFEEEEDEQKSNLILETKTLFEKPKEQEVKAVRLNGLLEDRLSILKEVIGEIYKEIEKRKELNKKLSKRIEKEIKYCDFLLRELLRELERIGNDLALIQRRIHLEKELNSLFREKREHKLRAFTEILWLKKELRELKLRYEWLTRTKLLLNHG
jgi:hypothetical protein